MAKAQRHQQAIATPMPATQLTQQQQQPHPPNYPADTPHHFAVLATPGVVKLAERTRPELEQFRINLARAMEAKSLSASALAKQVWGTMKDTRGIEVARNRDRMTHYLAGVSYPTPGTLTKLAQALDLDVSLLAREDGAAGNPGANPARPHALGVSMTLLAPEGGEPQAMVTLNKPLDLRTAMLIVKLCTARINESDLQTIQQDYMQGPQED